MLSVSVLVSTVTALTDSSHLVSMVAKKGTHNICNKIKMVESCAYDYMNEGHKITD